MLRNEHDEALGETMRHIAITCLILAGLLSFWAEVRMGSGIILLCLTALIAAVCGWIERKN
jgi:hypothetical protein